MRRLSLSEAAEITGRPLRFLHRAILLGGLRAERVNDERHYLIRPCDLAVFPPAEKKTSAAYRYLIIPFTVFPLVVFFGALECALVVSVLRRVWDTLEAWKAGVLGMIPVLTLVAAFFEVGLVVDMFHRATRVRSWRHAPRTSAQ